MNARNTQKAGAEADAAHINDQLLRTLTEKSLAGIYLVQVLAGKWSEVRRVALIK